MALAYILSFLAVCLGGCLAAAAPDAHGCCQSEDGLKAVRSSQDCCKVVPGVSAKHFAAAASAPAAPLSFAREAVSMTTIAHALPPVPAAAGPPLILRI